MSDETKDKFTPGPWVISRYGPGKATISGTDGHGAIATVLTRGTKTDNLYELAGNIALIVAAPKLLAALEAMVDATRKGFDYKTEADHMAASLAWNTAMAAIAKARGKL